MRTTSPLHAVTWALWAVAAAACVQLAPSPVYVTLVIGIALLVVTAHRLDTTLARAFPLLLGLGVTFAVIRVVLTALTSHDPGAAGPPPDAWFTLPQFTVPRILGGFTIGGTVDGVVVLSAASQAYAVVGVMAAFGAFNAVASHHELLQASPPAFHEPGLIVTVALAFVPSMMLAVQASREADRARTGGRAVRRGRLLRTAVPIVESGLERAMALAESMDSRGFAHHTAQRGDRVAAWLGLASMLALGGSFLALVGRASTSALVAAAAGTVGLAAAVVVASRGARHTRYRPRRATRLDVAVTLAVLGAPAGLAVLRALGHSTLVWWPSPIRFPEVSVWPVLCLALLAVPALVAPVPPLASSAPDSLDHVADGAAGRGAAPIAGDDEAAAQPLVTS
jgi:energy-coupling factor transport system permease protein